MFCVFNGLLTPKKRKKPIPKIKEKFHIFEIIIYLMENLDDFGFFEQSFLVRKKNKNERVSCSYKMKEKLRILKR